MHAQTEEAMGQQKKKKEGARWSKSWQRYVHGVPENAWPLGIWLTTDEDRRLLDAVMIATQFLPLPGADPYGGADAITSCAFYADRCAWSQNHGGAWPHFSEDSR